LHRHEGGVVLSLLELRNVYHFTQNLRARLAACAQVVCVLLTLVGVGREARRVEEFPDELFGRHANRVGLVEGRALHPVVRKLLLALVQICAADNLRAVCRELRIGGFDAVARFVEAIDEIARVLKFKLDEEGCGDIYPLAVNARGVRAALLNLPGPVAQPALVRVASQEIFVVLRDEKLRVVNLVRRQCTEG
jgi:hypothetical protein